MLVDTRRIVPASKFRANMPRYVAQSRRDRQPVPISHNGEVVGFFISTEDLEDLIGGAVRELLSDRMDDDANVPHEVVKQRIVRRSRRKAVGSAK